MRIKQKLISLLATGTLFVFGFTALFPATTYAQTQAQATECSKSFDGKSYTKKSDIPDRYASLGCDKDKGGNCNIFQTGPGGTGTGVAIECSKSPGTDTAPTPPTQGGTIDGCKSIETSIIKCDTKQDNPILSIILQVVNFLAVGVGIAVAGGITWGGFMYSQANGNSSKTLEAVHIVTNSVIGLLLFIFMYAILNWLIPGGLFN